MLKRSLVTILTFFTATLAFAQDVKLSDSVIYINDQPTAFYHKELNRSILKYNITVSSLSHELLIKAEVIRFDAPVEELKPFFYYELSFPSIADTFSIYIEDEAFPLVLGKIIRDYQLITHDQLDKNAVALFKTGYAGGPALLAKIQSVEDYLDATRHFAEQVKRDRTKPVSIVNDRLIMQDAVQIGSINEVEYLQVTNQPVYTTTVNASYRGKNNVPVTSVTDYRTRNVKETQFFLMSGRRLDPAERNVNYEGAKHKNETGKSLYEISKPKKMVPLSYTDQLLKKACYLVENFIL